ncbi:hypothetical protein N7444_011628 [Penicillium canescens]|nr:hypothetical protein N7444_011628 [Penicillium canescens]
MSPDFVFTTGALHEPSGRGNMAAAGPLCDESKERSSIDNPIMIDDDKRSDKQSISKQDNSDGDTEPLSTPVFWGCLGDGGLHVPPDNSESPLTDSTSGLAPSKSTHDQRLDCIHSPSLGPTTCSLAKEERSGAVEIAKGGEGTFV